MTSTIASVLGKLDSYAVPDLRRRTVLRNGLVRYRLMPEAERTPYGVKGSKILEDVCKDRLFVRMLGRIISAGCSKVLKLTLRRKALQLRTHWVGFTTLTE